MSSPPSQVVPVENNTPDEMDIDNNATKTSDRAVEVSTATTMADESAMDVDDATDGITKDAHTTVLPEKKKGKHVNPPKIDAESKRKVKPKEDNEESRKQYNAEGIEYLIRMWDNLDDPEAKGPMMGSVARKSWLTKFDLKFGSDVAKRRYQAFRNVFLADYGTEYPADIHLYYDQIKNKQRTCYVPGRPFPTGPQAAAPPAYAQLQVLCGDDTLGITYLPLQAIAQHTSKFELTEHHDSFVSLRFQVHGADTTVFERCIQCIFPEQVAQQFAHVLSDQPAQRLPDGLADALRARMALRPPPSMRTTTFPSERCNNHHLHGPAKTCFIMRVQYLSIDNTFFDAAMHRPKYKTRKERGSASRLKQDSSEEDSDDEPSSFEEFLQREKESSPELKVEHDTAHMPGPQNEAESMTDSNTRGIKTEED
jgi:hypothetical protein